MPAAPLAAGQSPVKFYVTSINQDKLQKASRQKSEVKSSISSLFVLVWLQDFMVAVAIHFSCTFVFMDKTFVYPGI